MKLVVTKIEEKNITGKFKNTKASIKNIFLKASLTKITNK